MAYYFEKQVKKTERADNINSVSPAKSYPCLKLVFNDNWNDYGFSTWYHLWYLVDRNKANWRSIGDVKIIHRDGDSYHSLEDSFSELDDNYCSLGMNLSYYKSLVKTRRKRGQYVEGDWDFKRETMQETISSLSFHEFIEKVVYENMLTSKDFSDWIVGNQKQTANS